MSAAPDQPAPARFLHVLRDPPLDGPANMARDEHLLESGSCRPAVVRLYAWDPPTISLGYFQRYDAVHELPDDVRQLAVVRRTTGGGAILHDREVTYCLVLDASLPQTHQAPDVLYTLVHTCWQAAIGADLPDTRLAPDSFPMPTPRTGPFFCFAKPGRTDLILGADKLLGSAQRRVDAGVLQHGSLLLGRRFASHPGVDLGEPPPPVVERWIAAFVVHLGRRLALEPRTAAWTASQLCDVERRREKYASAAWTHRR